jgi:uncharacterized protein DUF6484
MQRTDSDVVRAELADSSHTTHSETTVSLARFAGFDGERRFLIHIDGVTEPVVAISTVGLRDADVGVAVVIAFETRNSCRPVIMGRAHEREPNTSPPSGERIVIRGEREIELRCGDASILLTRAGKILIRGTYVLSRSRGANKIKGAFVDIN